MLRKIKIYFLSLFLLAISVASVRAAGTVSQELGRISPSLFELTFEWTADAADASIPDTEIEDTITAAIQGMYFEKMITDPDGDTAPTANYDITVDDENGIDLLAGAGADRSATASEDAYPASPISQAVTGTLTLTISNNAVNSAEGVVKLYFSRSISAGSGSAAASGGALESGGNLADIKTNSDTLAAIDFMLGTDFSGVFGSTANSASNPVYSAPGTGATPYPYISLASANLTNIKASAGTIYGIVATNSTETIYYLRLYDKASAPDPSNCSSNTDCPVFSHGIPTNAAGAGYAIPVGPLGMAFSNGIGFSITAGSCSAISSCNDETAAGAGVEITILYK